ncbi:unnamed protein product, partial [Brassica napus]
MGFMGLSSCECFQTWKWTDEEVRYFFALYADEKKKGNRPRSGMNLAGREFIVNKFEEK